MSHAAIHIRKTVPFNEQDKSELVTSKVPWKLKNAWDVLFEGMTTEEIIDHINSTWIDPRYKLVVVDSSHLPYEEIQ